MAPFPKIDLTEYFYELPKDRIAQNPLDKRDSSKLLVYRMNEIQHKKFKNIIEEIPLGSTLFFNDTKVISARLRFVKSTGGQIEIFLLSPISPTTEIQSVMETSGSTTWRCIIGNLKKWKGEVLSTQIRIESEIVTVEVRLLSRDEKLVEITWDEGFQFSQVISHLGKTPLPPYMNRKPTKEDSERYQTVYADKEGAVAAPTAGLHFTTEIINEINRKNVKLDYLTLHVSAGTFQPIQSDDVTQHPMHNEQISVSRNNIKNLLEASFRIAVGTTSMRTIESLYWYGCRLIEDEQAEFFIEKSLPYSVKKKLPDVNDSLSAVLNKMDREKTEEIHGSTEIFIVPGYQFRACDALITNFHLPKSTLILLIAAFIGPEWRSIYNEALNHNYRFLSYGDSSILFKD